MKQEVTADASSLGDEIRVAWLAGHGVRARRLTAKGLGQTQPVADNSRKDGMAKNRRVELAQE